MPTALACGDTGGDADGGNGGGSADSGDSGGTADGGVGGGVPAPGTGGGGAGSGSDSGGGGGAKPGPLKIPEWGQKGFLFDDSSTENWNKIKGLFIARCKDGTLCVDLVRVYRTEDGQPSNIPCGYDHMEPLAGTDVKRHTIVSVVGICASEPGDTGDTGTTGEPGDSGDPGSSPPVVPSPPVETVPAT
ncbi:hypothetical protein [Streptomyces sp. NPDC058371]|uniref:hypothetical protein n=1 Tax=Streptomyces sp. NPDC058371 TaxID=3346463 RepID=UPI0036464728